MFLNPGNPNLKSNSITFTLPASTPTGPGSIVVSNAGGGHSYSAKSNAVSVPIGARIIVTKVSQSGGTLTVDGTGFSTLTVINFFNTQAGGDGQPGRAEARRHAANSADAGQLDQVHLHGTGGGHGRTGVRAGAQSALRALHQQRQRPLRRVYPEVSAGPSRPRGHCAPKADPVVAKRNPRRTASLDSPVERAKLIRCGSASSRISTPTLRRWRRCPRL